jgi:hypothetical protein
MCLLLAIIISNMSLSFGAKTRNLAQELWQKPQMVKTIEVERVVVSMCF